VDKRLSFAAVESPLHGGSLWLGDSPLLRNPELALAFINFMCRPEVAAANMEWNLAQIPNATAYELVSDDVRNNPAIFLSDEVRNQCQMLDDVGEAIALYSKAWDRIKAAK
jgi:spermidine/putrescine transport system substrate-binding protein